MLLLQTQDQVKRFSILLSESCPTAIKDLMTNFLEIMLLPFSFTD